MIEILRLLFSNQEQICHCKDSTYVQGCSSVWVKKEFVLRQPNTSTFSHGLKEK